MFSVRGQKWNRVIPLGIVTLALIAGGCTQKEGSVTTTSTSSRSTTTTTTTSSGTSGTSSGHSPIVLTLADNGKQVVVGTTASIVASLPYSKASRSRWELVTSGPGLKETSTNATGATGREKNAMQNFTFDWSRTTPFGLVFFFEVPGHASKSPQEFAVVLDATKAAPTKPKGKK